MRKLIPAVLFAASLLAPGQMQAQEANGELERELRSMVIEPSPAEADRAVLKDFLDRDDVQEVASERGIDAERLQDRVATLDGEEASELAQRVRDVQDDLDQVGGDTLVISATTVIIILLIILLVAVVRSGGSPCWRPRRAGSCPVRRTRAPPVRRCRRGHGGAVLGGAARRRRGLRPSRSGGPGRHSGVRPP